MTHDAALALELRRLADELAALRRLVLERLPEPTAAAADRRVLEALPALYGSGQQFTSGELYGLQALPIGDRVELREALHAAGATDVRRLGVLLRRLADSRLAAGGVRLLALKTEAGARLWQLRGTEGNISRSS